ncbi:MAG: class I SAM-dependent methyltransferase [Chitinophagales bacterium]|nr:class I SAM-dependent methyltransferase [Chitinophagales bacterium]
MKLPDFDKAFEYENNFYLSCDNTRISKILAHYELFKMVQDLPGAIVECGVFKGASLVRFAAFRDLFGNSYSKKIIGFDIFGKFPETEYHDDKKYRQGFIDETGGGVSISVEQLETVFAHKGVNENTEFVKGDVTQTIPEYLRNNPHLKISLLNMDTDVYEPAVVILEQLYPRIVPGGILILDDYGVFPGETKAVDTYFADMKVEVKKFSFAMTPCYIIKK